jgi:hypothetical protein
MYYWRPSAPARHKTCLLPRLTKLVLLYNRSPYNSCMCI